MLDAQDSSISFHNTPSYARVTAMDELQNQYLALSWAVAKNCIVDSDVQYA